MRDVQWLDIFEPTTMNKVALQFFSQFHQQPPKRVDTYEVLAIHQFRAPEVIFTRLLDDW